MALALGVKLGGDTSYFGRVKKKVYFSLCKDAITKSDVRDALKII